MADITRIKQVNVTIAFILIWLFCVSIYLVFMNLVKICLCHSIIIILSETILCLTIWIFFMVKIDWLKDLQTGREITCLNISNILTSIRFCLIPLLITMFGIASSRNHSLHIKLIILLFGLLVGLTDFFDGILARVRNEVTMLGKVLDPISDFLMILGFSILVFVYGAVEWWYFILLHLRITLMGLFLIFMLVRSIRFTVKTTPLGKATIFYTMCLLGICTIKLLLQIESTWFDTFLYIIQVIGGLLILVSSIEKTRQLGVIILSDKNI